MGRFIVMCLWLLLFMLCNLGYWELFRKKTGVDPAYYPSLTVVVQVSLLFCGGVLNCLREVAYALWLLGLGCLVWEIVRERSLRFLRFYRKPVFAFLLVFTATFFAHCYGWSLQEYDNFTHWGLVLKQMVTQKHFPDFRDPFILFQTYPLGTTVYMFFGLSLPKMGMREDIAMFLQAYMMICYTAALFSRYKKHPLPSTAFMALVMTFFVSTALGMRDLRVDVVLALAAGCSMLYVWDHCVKPGESKDFYLGIFYLVALSQMKNSAMLMALICSAAILWEGRRDRRYGRRAVVALAPVAAWFLWKKRYSNVYLNADISAHAMTLRNYIATFTTNPVGKIKEVTLELLRYAVTFRKTVLCAVCFVLVGVLVWLVWKRQKDTMKRAAVFSWLFYVGYQVFLLAMYVFSMGTEESAGLPSVARYTNTALFIMNYMLCAVCMRTISEAELREKKQALCVAILLLMYPARMLLCGETPFFVQQGPKENPRRQSLEALIAEYQVPDNSSYCMLVPEDDNGLLALQLRYALLSNRVRVLHNPDEEALNSITEPYVFVYDGENPAVCQWLSERHPDNVVMLPREFGE